MDDMRRVAGQPPALAQRLEHKRDVALPQVPHATVHELGRAARGALAEIALLEQRHGVTARRGIDGDADACRAAADDGEIPGLAAVEDALEKGVPVHRSLNVE